MRKMSRNLRTREVYFCAANRGGQMGLEWRPGDNEKVMAANLRMFLSLRDIEAGVKTVYPDRAYWIELGSDELWMQTVEYGAFNNKPHKALNEASRLRIMAARKNERGRTRNRPDGKKRVRS
jgi:hypothetical protein